MLKYSFLSIVSLLWGVSFGQDYSVTDIDCAYGDSYQASRLSAQLIKPDGFRGSPVFADDRLIDPALGGECSIRQAGRDTSGLVYDLLVTDFSSCGVVIRNGFISLRIWFPQLPGVVMMSDQEVIIMCKPPQSKITTSDEEMYNRKQASRVSGSVEREPGRLVYEVALYREAEDDTAGVDIDQPVPIGTKLQLRASIDTKSVWSHVKLVELSLSPSKTDPHAGGHVRLVDGGCRVEEFAGIVPRQPWVAENTTGEVRVEFEAVLLDVSREVSSRVWIHVRTMACTNTNQDQCKQDVCEDAWHGRRSRSIGDQDYGVGVALAMGESEELRVERDLLLKDMIVEMSDKVTDFTDNIGLSVIMPGEGYNAAYEEENSECTTFLIFGILMGCLLIVASGMMCLLAHRLNRVARSYKREKANSVMRDHRKRYGIEPGGGGLFRSEA